MNELHLVLGLYAIGTAALAVTVVSVVWLLKSRNGGGGNEIQQKTDVHVGRKEVGGSDHDSQYTGDDSDQLQFRTDVGKDRKQKRG